MAERRRLFGNFIRFRVGKAPSDIAELPIEGRDKDIITTIENDSGSEISVTSRFNQFRRLAEDRQTQYSAYDEMKSDSVISAALELYADDATQYDEQGRVIWVESDSEEITKAGNRLLDILEIPERAWKHVYQACLYGDYYLKLYRENDIEEEDEENSLYKYTRDAVKVVNDVRDYKGHNEVTNYVEYVEDVEDPATMFDLRRRGKTSGFIQVKKEAYEGMSQVYGNTFAFQLKDIDIYRPDRFVHVIIGENMSRDPEEISIELGEGNSVTYRSVRGKSILQDVYPIQKELQLLEDSLLLNRLTRSSLIRLLEIELGDMPKTEVNSYLRRVKNLIEQHISMDKDTGTYKSYNAPGPIDNVIYIPVRNGKGSISVNNLGGDVNVRDIADIDYFNNKRSGALKIPRAYLGDDMDGSGLSNGGSLTRLSIRYARTVKRIQTSYIRAITTLLNLFFVDKKLDYVNRFTVRMTSPSTQEDLERNELINGNIELVGNMMDLVGGLDDGTQKKILNHLISNIMKMPEIAEMIENSHIDEDGEDISGGNFTGGGGPGPDFDFPDNGDGTVDMTSAFEDENGEEENDEGSTEGGFTEDEFSEFEDEI